MSLDFSPESDLFRSSGSEEKRWNGTYTVFVSDGRGNTVTIAELASIVALVQKLFIGSLFERNKDGNAFTVERAEYAPNKIWTPTPRGLMLSSTLQPGDTDGDFIVNAAGNVILMEQKGT